MTFFRPSTAATRILLASSSHTVATTASSAIFLPQTAAFGARPRISTTVTAFTRRMMSSSSNSSSSSSSIGQNIEFAKLTLAQADCVCFDVDSTVINEEGIDVLAEFLGKGEKVASLTKQAMEGGMKFQDALAARLELLEPSKASIEECLKATPLQLTPGVHEFIQKLQNAQKDVFLVSGGFRLMIQPVADILSIPRTQIYANTILFDGEGMYTGFDTNEPTSQDMGKPRALEQIQARGNYQTMVMIGDGATDAQAKPPAAAFIGFGGVAVREKVKQVADWFVLDFQDLIDVLDESV